MALTKECIQNLFHRALDLHKEEQEINKLANKYYSRISDSHTPVFNETRLAGFLDAIVLIDHELHDSLEYFLYEAQGMDKPIGTYKGKTYNLADIDEAVEFHLVRE